MGSKPSVATGARRAVVSMSVVALASAALLVAPSVYARGSRGGSSQNVPFTTGNYHGTTSQHLAISFHASRTKITKLAVHWVAQCLDTSTYTTYTKSGETTGLPPMHILNGSFAGHIIWQGVLVSFAVKLHNTKAKGVFNTGAQPYCNTSRAPGAVNGEIVWTAKHT